MGRIARTIALLAALCGTLLTVPLVGSAQAAEYTRIRSIDSDARGKCLGISDLGRGSEVQMARCDNYAMEYWLIDTLFDNRIRLRSASGSAWGKCIDASRGNTRQLIMVRCDGSANQAFIRQYTGSGTWYTLESVRYRGLCVDVKDWGRSHIVQLWQCHDFVNQVWESIT